MPKSRTQTWYRQYVNRMRALANVKNAMAVLQWDQETYLPPKGAQARGQQLTTLAELAHHMATSSALGRLLQSLLDSSDLPETARRNVELSWEDYQKMKKYPTSLVKALTEASNRCFTDWIQARKENRFSLYQPALERMITLKLQEADILGYEALPYDALLDQHEKKLTTSTVETIFQPLQKAIVDLLAQIQQKPQPEDDFLYQYAPKQHQWDLGIYLLQSIGFDFEAGRQDLSEHPFTTSFHPHDVRITTRIHEHHLPTMIWSCIHEGGHALYEQGLPVEEYGLPAGQANSLVIHESQSRLWENCIGRSLSFWQFHYLELQKRFPEIFSTIPLQQFYRAINKVQPSLIRTEADELTYHLHIIIRYEIEKKLINERLPVKSIPELWNALYADWLQVVVPDDLHGVLQDVHWSHGSIGYFPTYTLGSVLAAQWWDVLQQSIPDLHQQMAKGNTQPILDWLRKHIHAYGSLFHTQELCQRVTGKPLDIAPFLQYVKEKFSQIYGLTN
ncbi:MAG: carboxypeptidase M32 [Thermoflavifilum sp.]|nr:carboxypeptidase M32 [Thermoflavifilum sp.]